MNGVRQVLVIVIILTLRAGYTYGCLSASQNRLYPLGTTSNGLLVVETRLQRSHYPDKANREIIGFKPAWWGVCYFKTYDWNFKEVHSEVLDTLELFEQRFYDSIVGQVFAKGLDLAKKYPDFVPAKPMSISFCGYQETCSKAVILFDSLDNKVFIQLPGKNTYQVKQLADTSSIASNLLSYHSLEYMSARGLKGIIYINSVRQFQIGDKRLTIVHIGSGQISDWIKNETYPPGKESAAKFTFNDISHSVFDEPVLHHGRGFDFAIWE